MQVTVAPHMGAWIEIKYVRLKDGKLTVAPHMGAWIEIRYAFAIILPLDSRTPHGCVD